MKKMILTLLVCAACFLAFPSDAGAQSMGHDYRTGLGVKFGWWHGGGLDIKHFIKSDAALEGVLSFWGDGFVLTGLYEFHGPITGAPGLLWYVGPGAHIGFWNDNYYYNGKHYDGAFFGLDGILGLDYKFNGAPIDVSLDIQPGFDVPHGGFFVGGGLALRYTF